MMVEYEEKLDKTLFEKLSLYRLVIFDFDGTLVDTSYDVAICMNEAFVRKGYPEREIEDIIPLLGGRLEDIIKDMLLEKNESIVKIDEIAWEYKRIYRDSRKEHSLPYKGITDLLELLKSKQISLSINSNKPQELLDKMVNNLFTEGLFECVIGYQSNLDPKPSPKGALNIMEYCGVKPNETIYVGDGEIDFKTAVNAQIDFLRIFH